jgi:hypothetical protein
MPDKETFDCNRDAQPALARPSGSANALQAATEAWVMAVQKYYEREPNRSELTQVFMRGYFAGWSEREVAQLADALADNAKRLPSWPNDQARRRGGGQPEGHKCQK